MSVYTQPTSQPNIETVRVLSYPECLARAVGIHGGTWSYRNGHTQSQDAEER